MAMDVVWYILLPIIFGVVGLALREGIFTFLGGVAAIFAALEFGSPGNPIPEWMRWIYLGLGIYFVLTAIYGEVKIKR